MLVGRPWPKKYLPIPKLEGIAEFEPDYFHELITLDEACRSRRDLGRDRARRS